ncbi:hypothetical protein SAICODRAFT_194351 [Saitoella complicata NRRL Y-17804]|uniref:Uncharacterized protein n=1 Tax=Saitoella complicata (strain BCRC 22490 / CBS 7301 / JCM 7358 / NBRC 10748 / NRRL Y-17804) TaxID=698492 RepID=A0A0E9NEA3_SAICN|nr:uncharacterized protein SAICODRAFT_194351 [Saitoella complicata NRRL Y-17804]ODQ49636.1 hypothetical protein SAICODRAFT_194351 [Saitoella complicata NRRL Y-17804]GAO48138.1 hypothetical protein G7K_2320-t1 [Saitoella complicata NRRL Y-17804]
MATPDVLSSSPPTSRNDTIRHAQQPPPLNRAPSSSMSWTAESVPVDKSSRDIGPVIEELPDLEKPSPLGEAGVNRDPEVEETEDTIAPWQRKVEADRIMVEELHTPEPSSGKKRKGHDEGEADGTPTKQGPGVGPARSEERIIPAKRIRKT